MSRRKPQAPTYAPLFPELPLRENAVLAPGEIVVVNFAGGGGASEGIARAMRRPVNIAINHDPVALGMHRINHPHTTHYIEDVWQVDPREAVGGRPVALAQFSPDCTHFSQARSRKPRSKKVRGLAWVAVRWAATVRPRVIVLENVKQFALWGPLDRAGQPIPEQEGRTFRSFLNALRHLGYEVEHRLLRACDYGAGTTRERFFLIARRDGQPIQWPEPTHAAPDDPRVLAGQLRPWPVVADFIDWTLPIPSVFAPGRDLVPNTLSRIARGFERYTLRAGQPYLVNGNHSGAGFRGQALGEPLRTITASHEALGVTTACLVKHYGGGYTGAGLPMTGPVDTITTQDHHALTAAHLLVWNRSHDDYAQPLGAGLRTIRTRDSFGVTVAQAHALPTDVMLARARQVYALLMAHLGAERLGENADHDRQLVHLDLHGARYVVWDLCMRMLQPRELYLCQGFRPGYVIDRTADGRKLSQKAQVHMCGNSVPPHPMEQLTLHNLSAQWQEAAD